MKKIVCLMLGLITTGLLSACGSSSKTTNTETFIPPRILTCDDFPTTEGKETCKDSEALAAALAKKDPALCLKIFDKKRAKGCQESIGLQNALEKGDVSFCEMLDSSIMAENCKKDIYMSLAQKTGDTSYCEKIENEAIARTCRDTTKNTSKSK